MRTNSILTILAIVLSAGVAPVRAEVCPAQSEFDGRHHRAVNRGAWLRPRDEGVRILPVWRQRRRPVLATP